MRGKNLETQKDEELLERYDTKGGLWFLQYIYPKVSE